MMPEGCSPSCDGNVEPGIGAAATAFDLGLAARRGGNQREAIAWFRRALATEPTHRRSRIELATILREQKRPQEAEAIYRALLADEPGAWQALAGLGLCARQRRDLAAAAGHLAAALAAASLAAAPLPPERWVRLEYAATLREQGRAEEAEAVYRAVLADEPGAWRALAGLGLCARQRRDLAAAAGHLAAALAAASLAAASLAAAPVPPERWLRLEYAGTLREQGRAEAAEAIYCALLADEPGAWQALIGLGLCARLRRDLAASAGHLAAALAAAPRERWVRLEYATTLREQKRPEAAEAVYHALLADEPGAWQAMVGLGLCARLRNDRGGAIAHFIAATRAAPDADAPWFELVGEYRDAGRFDEARAILHPLLDRDPAGAQARLSLGLVERSAGDRPAALEVFRQGYARYPERHQFAIEIATEEQGLGRLAEAERWLLRASEIDALAGAALAQLGEMLRAGHQLERAFGLFQRAATLPGAPVWVHSVMAQTLTELGRAEEAFGVLDAAEHRLGRLPELALKRVSLLRHAGFRDEALAIVRDAVAAAPTHFPLWFEWFWNERLSGNFAGIDSCLDAAPAATVRDRAHVYFARGLVAQQRWQLDLAAAMFGEAVALDASLSWMHEARARVDLLRFDTGAARQHLAVMKRLRAATQRQQGLSPHLTHTHIGQLLEEFLMDRTALGAVTEALAGPAERRVDRLLALTRATPENTPTAIALLLALRQAGSSDLGWRKSGSARIPARIAQYWDEAMPPPDVCALMQSWRDRNPAYRYLKFDHGSAVAFLKANYTPEVLRAYLRAREPAMKADLFRLGYLFAEGGCYADADDRCLRPLGELLPPFATLVVWHEDFGTLGNNFIAASPLHPMLGLALQLAVQAINRGDDDLLWLATGPGLITRAFAQILATSALQPSAWLERTVILDRHELERVVAIHCGATYKNSRRHWTRSAFGQPKQALPAR